LSPSAPILHATLVARWQGGDWRGVLLQGPSGAGKSDLALRLIADGWWLVADDRVLIWTDAGHLYGRAPTALAALLELRGQGVRFENRHRHWSAIHLCIDCLPPGAELERVPEPRGTTILGLPLRLAQVTACEASCVARINRLAELP
jgi:serine kinase of HPr protein (carbohydrate metabolism regulator)